MRGRWVVGSHGLVMRTADGGVTWSGQGDGVTARSLLDVEFENRLEGWAVGAKGTIIRSRDSGGIVVNPFTEQDFDHGRRS